MQTCSWSSDANWTLQSATSEAGMCITTSTCLHEHISHAFFTESSCCAARTFHCGLDLRLEAPPALPVAAAALAAAAAIDVPAAAGPRDAACSAANVPSGSTAASSCNHVNTSKNVYCTVKISASCNKQDSCDLNSITELTYGTML
jgi:hypothetical protein